MSIGVTVPDAHSPKHSGDARWYKLQWSDHLSGITDTINTSTWTVPSGITAVSDDVVDTNTNTRIKVSGGTSGQTYKLKNTITTVTGGETIVGYIVLHVSDDPNNTR